MCEERTLLVYKKILDSQLLCKEANTIDLLILDEVVHNELVRRGYY
jgi:hypothetical protein